MLYSGKKVIGDIYYSDGSKKEVTGTLVDFYPSANEGIFALVKLDEEYYNMEFLQFKACDIHLIKEQ
jgi:hypothetical protein